MKILITGATGLIGQSLGRSLVAAGHTVSVLVRKFQPEDLTFPAQLFLWRDQTQRPPAEALDGVDAVIHLAGEPIAGRRWSSKVKNKIYSSRIQGTQLLVEALNESSVKTLISASAIGVYGNRDDEELDEFSKPGSDFLAKVCTDWEKQAHGFKGRVVTPRIGVVLSRQGGAFEKMVPPFRDGYGAPLASGLQWMSWIHLEDLVRLLMWCLDNSNVEGAINATSPLQARNLDFSQLLAEHYGRKMLPPVPPLALRVLLGEMSSFLLASTKVRPTKALEMGFEFKHSGLKEAIEDLLPKLAPYENEVIFEQWIPKPLSEACLFFEDEMNLEQITPPWLNFKIINKTTAQIQKGTLLNYRLKVHGLPIRWQTHIEDWKPQSSFVDTQTKGPYSRWHHTHLFEKLGPGTLVTDRIIYKLPVGLVGYLGGHWMVRADIQKIFKYRRGIIHQLLGSK